MNALCVFHIVAAHALRDAGRCEVDRERVLLRGCARDAHSAFNRHAGRMLKEPRIYRHTALNQRDAGEGRHGYGETQSNGNATESCYYER